MEKENERKRTRMMTEIPMNNLMQTTDKPRGLKQNQRTPGILTS
jgi:hypothetical protein